MAREQTELGPMGFFGIYKEAYKITVSWKKIFSQITLAFILPLSILYLSEIQISDFIHTKTFRRNETSRWIAFGIFEVIYMLGFLLFSLLSTSVVSYTIACIYMSKEITFKKVIRVFPRVWKRLLVTFLWGFFIFAVYTGVVLVLLFLFSSGTFGSEGEGAPKILIFIICLSIPYFIGFVYINIVWQVASVISVLEKTYGRKALRKSMKLIKGKIWVSSAIFIMLGICLSGIVLALSLLVVNEGIMSSVAGKVGVGILCYLLLPIYFLFTLVIQTVIYFVCKSHHHEDINFTDPLDVSFVPLGTDKDVQLEQVPV